MDEYNTENFNAALERIRKAAYADVTHSFRALAAAADQNLPGPKQELEDTVFCYRVLTRAEVSVQVSADTAYGTMHLSAQGNRECTRKEVREVMARYMKGGVLVEPKDKGTSIKKFHMVEFPTRH